MDNPCNVRAAQDETREGSGDMPTAHPDGDIGDGTYCWQCNGSCGWWTTGDDMPDCDPDDECMCGMCDWIDCDACGATGLIEPRSCG